MRASTKTIRLLQDILRNNVAGHPEKIALVCENRRLTYAQIDEMSDRLANALRHNGLEDGQRVLLYLFNSVELVVSIFAVLKANAVFSVIDYANTFDTLRYIAADCEATVLITNQYQLETATRLSGEIPSMRFAVIAGLDAGKATADRLAFDAIQENYPPDPLPRRMIDRDMAFLLYTSGSTGQSKGVVVTHRSALTTVENGVEYFGLHEQDIHASPLPVSSSPGVNQILQIFLAGATLVLEKSFAYPAVTLKRMAAEGVTGFASVPTILAILLQMDLSRYDLSRLRYITSVGAVLPPSLIQQLREKLPQISLYSFYGLAEAAYTLGLDPEQIDRRPNSVGKPFPGTQAWIADENGHRLGPNEIGELVTRGSHVRSGYWNAPLISAQRFRSGPLPGELVCYTGDMFRMDEAGYYYFAGRTDEIIKSGAKKIAPMEIENVLYEHAGVLEAAVIGIPDPVLGQVIKAFVVPHQKARDSLTVEDILRYCHQKLEAYKVPRFVEISDPLPKTPSGKIKKINLA
jgi:acyl-CoA synthetase (AMP-forming)/AMP-acid ligase II